jgi:hypothetical protein
MDRKIKMPRGWRDDIDFMLEFCELWPLDALDLQAIRRGEHVHLGRVRWFVNLAIRYFPDAADYRELLKTL